MVVNPQAQALLDRLYSQTLTRVYVDARGYRVFLSLAYGDDQRDGLQAHKPEVCYPAFGFNLRSRTVSQLVTAFGSIPIVRLDTQLGSRQEPVTYWFSFAGKVVSNRLEQRWTEIKLGLSGRVPHGLLFRVSSIDGEPDNAFRQQDRFVNDLLAAVSESDRSRLGGFSTGLPERAALATVPVATR
jgi:EpsI family protein